MERAVKELVELSTYAGDHPRFVQGGGGNCSVKSGGIMVIKASGCLLEEVSERAGYARVDLKTGRPAGDGPRPSLEIGLHRLLGSYVIHSHPIVVCALVCAEEGAKNCGAILPDIFHRWIPYASPGPSVMDAVRRDILDVRPPRDEWVIFLQNHGLLVSAETRNRCMELHEAVVRRLEKFFAFRWLKDLPIPPPGRYLTPDHAVYGAPSFRITGEKQRQAREDITVFVGHVQDLVARKGWSPRWLSGPEADFILGMSEESYRRKFMEPAP